MLTYYNVIFVTDHTKLGASSWDLPILGEIQIISLKQQLDFFSLYNCCCWES